MRPVLILMLDGLPARLGELGWKRERHEERVVSAALAV